jgi:hypothetical protein
MRFSHSRKLTAVSLGICLIAAFAAAGCSQSTPTGPSPTGSIVARDLTTAVGAATAASFSASVRGADSGIVGWECFSGGSPGSCPAPRVSAMGVATGEVVTTAPGNLSRTVNGTTVVLSWGAAQGATSYVIEAGSASGASNITVFDTGSAGLGLTVNNVPAGTYFVRVRGRDAAGNGPASNEVMVVVGGPGPAPGPGTGGSNCQPRNLTATVIGSTVALGWNSPSAGSPQCGWNSYLVQIGSTPGASDLAQASTPGLINTYSVPGAPAGTYYIRVRSQGPGGVSAPTNEVVVTVTGVAPPGTTTWTGLVANGEGSTGADDDCGVVRADVTLTLVQSGTSVTGISSIFVRSVTIASCQGLVGLTIAESFTGTVTGSFPNGSGTHNGVSPGGSSFSASFANGRMTGTSIDSGGDAGTFIMTRR